MLVQLESRAQVAAQAAAERSLKSAQQMADLQKQRYDRGVVDVVQTAQADHELENAKTELAKCTAAVDATRIIAPFDGTIVRQSIEPGVVVTAGQPMAQLVATGSPRIEFNIPQQFVGSVSKGTSIKVRAHGGLRESYPGEVAFVTPSLDATSRTQLAIARPTGDTAGLLAGMYVTVQFKLAPKP